MFSLFFNWRSHFICYSFAFFECVGSLISLDSPGNVGFLKGNPGYSVPCALIWPLPFVLVMAIGLLKCFIINILYIFTYFIMIVTDENWVYSLKISDYYEGDLKVDNNF